MRSRGRVQPGSAADITRINFDKAQDKSDWKHCMNSPPSTGIPHVMVNSTVVVKDSKVLKGV